jgi:hypothetical protein
MATIQKIHEGKRYITFPAAAKMLGTTTTKLKGIIASEGMAWRNFQTNGKLFVKLNDIRAYLKRRDAGETTR